MKNRLLLAIALVVVVAAVLIVLRVRNSGQLEANIAGPATPVGADFPREEREKFAKELENAFKAKGINATITVLGDNSTAVEMEIPGANKEKAGLAAANGQVISDLRSKGFKRLTITNGKESWQVDLKN